MAQTMAGQMKQAASRTGLTVEAWKGKRAAGLNWCIDCRDWFPIEDFHLDASRFSGFQQYCKPCAKVRGLACRYRITKAEARLLLQTTSCAICARTGQKFEIDHDHQSGAVRGVLCSRCNNALGQFCDNVELLKKAITYLERVNGFEH